MCVNDDMSSRNGKWVGEAEICILKNANYQKLFLLYVIVYVSIYILIFIKYLHISIFSPPPPPDSDI